MMEIRNELPPNFEAIASVFPAARKPGVLFCYGNIIYNPTCLLVQKVLIAHEEIHSAQQERDGIEFWWDSYLASPKYRFNQEFPAHVAEYKFFKRRHDNLSKRREYLEAVAQRLSSPLYGECISYEEALEAIRKEAQKK